MKELISLEWIDGGKSGNKRRVLFLSLDCLIREYGTEQQVLENGLKPKGFGVGFNVDVQPLMNN